MNSSFLLSADTFKVQTIILFFWECFAYDVIDFELTIYGRYILSSGNSHLLTAIRSMWSKVPWKDFQALTCSLLSVNILFQCPSLSCHICSVVYPLTFLLKGKVYLKHAWSDLLFPTAGTGHDQKSVLSYRVTLTKGEAKENKEKANGASIKILPLKGILKCNDGPLYCIYFNLSYWIPFCWQACVRHMKASFRFIT